MRWVGPRHMVSTLKRRPVEHGPKQQFYIVQHITFLYNSSILLATNVPNASRFLTVLDCHPCYKYSIRYRLILKKSKLFLPNVCFISCFKSVCDKFCQNLTRVNCTAYETLPGQTCNFEMQLNSCNLKKRLLVSQGIILAFLLLDLKAMSVISMMKFQ